MTTSTTLRPHWSLHSIGYNYISCSYPSTYLHVSFILYAMRMSSMTRFAKNISLVPLTVCIHSCSIHAHVATVIAGDSCPPIGIPCTWRNSLPFGIRTNALFSTKSTMSIITVNGIQCPYVRGFFLGIPSTRLVVCVPWYPHSISLFDCSYCLNAVSLPLERRTVVPCVVPRACASYQCAMADQLVRR